jgi:hypothetical protein
VPSAALVICIPKYLDETAAGCWLPGCGSCVVPIVMVGLAQPPAKHKNKTAAIAEPVLIRIIDFPLETDSNPRRRADPCT